MASRLGAEWHGQGRYEKHNSLYNLLWFVNAFHEKKKFLSNFVLYCNRSQWSWAGLVKVNRLMVVQLLDVNTDMWGRENRSVCLAVTNTNRKYFCLFLWFVPSDVVTMIVITSSELGEWQALHRVICRCFDQLTTVSVNSNKNLIRVKWIFQDLKGPGLIENLDSDFLRADNFVISPKTKWDIFRGCFKIKFDELPL